MASNVTQSHIFQGWEMLFKVAGGGIGWIWSGIALEIMVGRCGQPPLVQKQDPTSEKSIF